MKYRYFTCDVFTETRFGGNQLAVLPDAAGLSDLQMQQITREFNYSETTFVFPPEAGGTRRVRIFVPAQEITFAGHPNVGTAFVLATTGAFGTIESSLAVTFEEKAGVVPITIRAHAGRITSCELKAPQPVSFGEKVPARLIASAVSLAEADIVTVTHEPQEVSVGLPFVFADPATGSAGCAVAGLLAHHDARANGEFAYRIVQGVEMGRPRLLLARAEKSDGAVSATWVGGGSVLVSERLIEVD